MRDKIISVSLMNYILEQTLKMLNLISINSFFKFINTKKNSFFFITTHYIDICNNLKDDLYLMKMNSVIIDNNIKYTCIIY